MFEPEHILGRWSGYALSEDRVRTALLRRYAELARAPSIDELAAATVLPLSEVRAQLAKLRERDLVVLSSDGERILGAYPFTDRATGHRVVLGGRAVKAMCAVDALGVGAMFGCDIQVDSRCLRTGSAIRITTRELGQALGDVRPATAIAWLGLRYEGGCAASSLCTVTAFFRADDELAAWRQESPTGDEGVRLSVAEALEAGRAIFGPSLAGDIQS